MTRYLILIHGDNEAFESMPSEEAAKVLETLDPFETTVATEGRLLSTHRLTPARDSTLIEIRNGEKSITDGPYTETKEQLGGYYLVEARDRAQVLQWLELIPPMMDSTLEVREVIEEERSLP